METLNTIEKITLLVSTGIVCLANLFVLLERAKRSEKQNGNNSIQKLGAINLRANNKTIKTLLSITLFLSSFLINAQDTIYFKNKTIVAAKITEVGISEIKYQRLDNLTGPNYLSVKSEIFLIKYSNGVIDSIRSTPPVAASTITITEFKSNPNQIRFSGNRIIYHNKTISDRKLNLMVRDHPSPETQIRLTKEFKKLNGYKLMENGLAPGLFVTGAVVHGYALSELFGGHYDITNSSNVTATFIAGALLRISGHVVNIVYRNKKKSKRAEIVDIYNGF